VSYFLLTATILYPLNEFLTSQL